MNYVIFFKNTEIQLNAMPFFIFKLFYFFLAIKRLLNSFFPQKSRIEDEDTINLFSSIQVFTACFAGFAHGANDVRQLKILKFFFILFFSNCIAPIAALFALYENCDVEQRKATPFFILFYGVVCVSIGLWVLGHHVMKTVGQKISEIHPARYFILFYYCCFFFNLLNLNNFKYFIIFLKIKLKFTIFSGFTIEFGAALTTIIASKLCLPISTTHCLVNSLFINIKF